MIKKNLSYEKALLGPTDAYEMPQDVLKDERLTRQQKLRILESWALDERALNRAENENMRQRAPEHDNLLQEIVSARRELEKQA